MTPTHIPLDLLPPPGPVLLSRVEAARTPESVAQQIKVLGVDAVRWMQRKGYA